MEKVLFFTSITPNYLAKARVLYKTLKKHNPDAYFVLGICDSKNVSRECLSDPFDAFLEFDSVENITNKRSFLFKHNVTELCTAVKPFYAEELIKRYHADKVIYLDPDIAVFDSLTPLSTLLDQSSIILTPHQLAHENEDLYIRENEILFLKRGSFNLGFFGVKADDDGLDFLHWWQNRLLHYCFDDDYEVLPDLSASGLLGLFTDQKWIDLVPSFFPNHIIVRDPGYNVCTWNLSHRHIESKDGGRYFVNGYPLRFFHFSGYDSGGHQNELQKSLKYYPHNKAVLLLDNWYEKLLQSEGQDRFGNLEYSLTKYDNGETIQQFERKIYHIRKDTHHIFGDPFKVTTSEPCYYYWVRNEYGRYFNRTLSPNFNQEEVIAYRVMNKWLPIGSLRRKLISKAINRFFKK